METRRCKSHPIKCDKHLQSERRIEFLTLATLACTPRSLISGVSDVSRFRQKSQAHGRASSQRRATNRTARGFFGRSSDAAASDVPRSLSRRPLNSDTCENTAVSYCIGSVWPSRASIAAPGLVPGITPAGRRLRSRRMTLKMKFLTASLEEIGILLRDELKKV
ncbi:hypothetical protein EVAR_94456_1 [Eumeta japonica]|uniref:Uncharacterized protein n=1 Tax=Eumeta variegata TaxID=151549 RepID=A0A4C1ZSK1_EUMVA|nr:hypothetical protein EVAR_94456_1 [Eumeta japonica]